jgi:DUF4097 and DUF4098 domain-containing protein YvlB
MLGICAGVRSVKNILSIKALMVCSALLVGFWANDVQAAKKGSFERTLSVDEAILLDVSTGSGSITISNGKSGTVEIVGHIKVGSGFFKRSAEEVDELIAHFEANPPVELENGRLKVGHIKDRAYRKNVSISYEILVPADTKVISDSGSGSQKISGVAEVVKADTGSGTITLTDINGPVKADTGSGAIKAERIAGGFDADTGSGSVSLTQVAPGDVDVSTGSGSITLQGVVGALRADAGSGRVVIQGSQAGDWDIDTGSGSIKIDLPDDAAFRLDAKSNSGGITVDHPVTVQGKISKRHLRGEVRGGGDSLKLDTGSGSIKVL